MILDLLRWRQYNKNGPDFYKQFNEVGVGSYMVAKWKEPYNCQQRNCQFMLNRAILTSLGAEARVSSVIELHDRLASDSLVF